MWRSRFAEDPGLARQTTFGASFRQTYRSTAQFWSAEVWIRSSSYFLKVVLPLSHVGWMCESRRSKLIPAVFHVSFVIISAAPFQLAGASSPLSTGECVSRIQKYQSRLLSLKLYLVVGREGGRSVQPALVAVGSGLLYRLVQWNGK